MPWIAFARDFDWRLPSARGHVVIAYKAGMVELVSAACAAAAIAAGTATKTQRPEHGIAQRQPRSLP